MKLANKKSISAGQKKCLSKAIESGLSVLKVPIPMSLSEWADDHFYLSAESSSIIGAWETLPYQRAIMNAISNDDIKIMTWRKSARVGYTKVICAAVGYFAEHKKRNQLIYQPTDSDAKDFVKDEIDPMLRDVPAIKNMLKCDPKKKSPDNTLKKKGFIGSVLDIRGGNSPRNFRRMTKDIVYYDELDGFDPDIGKEGSSTKLGDKRIETSSFPKSIRGSTPKIAGQSQIEDSLEDADLVFERYLPCPECGSLAPLEWSNMQFTDNDYRTAKVACTAKGCGVLIEYSQYAKMDKIGVWKTETGEWIENDLLFKDSDNNYIDAPIHIGFKIWSAYSYFKTWQHTVRDFISANEKKKKGDITDLKTFINTSLGQVWVEERGEKADDTTLYRRREAYDKVPNKGTILTAFCDVQDDRVECEVQAWGANEENWSIEYFILFGNLSISQIWANLATRLRNNYTKEDGSIINIAMTGIDSGGHYTDEVYNFSKKMGIKKVIPTKGYSEYGKPIATYPKKKNAKGVYLTMIGTDTAKELVYSRYEIQEPGGGYYHHPINDQYNEDYFKQATAEEKITKYKKGKRYYVWDAKKRRNEVLDCKVGNLAIVRILQQHFGLVLKEAPEVKKKVKKKVPTKQRGGFVNRYRR